MKQTEEEIYDYLRADGRLRGLTEKQARAAVKCYSKFCAKFKNNRIPNTFGVQYISAIRKGINASSFYFSFKEEEYLFTNGNAFKSVTPADSKKGSLNFSDTNLSPSIDQLDWRYQKLSEENIYAYFTKEKLFKRSGKRKFNIEDKKRAATYYKKRCDMVYDHRLIEFLAIDNIHHIEFAENGNNFKFYFNDERLTFYYFGINPSSGKFEVW